MLKLALQTKYVHKPTYTGGMERFNDRLATQLTRDGAKVDVLTGPNMRRFLPDQTMQDEYRNGYLITYFQNTLQRMSSIVIGCSKGLYDAVHFSDIWGLDTDKKAFEEIYNIQKPIIWRAGNMATFTEFPYPEQFAKFTAKVSQFVVNSTALAQEATNCGVPDDKLKVIPNPINLKTFKPVDRETKLRLRRENSIPEHDIVYLHAGRFQESKGTDFLLNQWNDIAPPHSTLLLVGGPLPEPEEQKKYNDLISGISSGHTVVRTGFIKEEEEMAKLNQLSDVLLAPSESEGLPNMIIEAMACGLVCVVSDKGMQTGVGDLIVAGKNGVVMSDYTGLALNQAINSVSADMGQNATHDIRNLGLDVEKITAQYQQIYSDLANANVHNE